MSEDSFHDLEPEDVLSLVTKIPEPSARMRALAHEMAELHTALEDVGYDANTAKQLVDTQILIGLRSLRRGEY